MRTVLSFVSRWCWSDTAGEETSWSSVLLLGFSSSHCTAGTGTCTGTSTSVLPPLCMQSTQHLWAHSLSLAQCPPHSHYGLCSPQACITLLVSRLLTLTSGPQPASFAHQLRGGVFPADLEPAPGLAWAPSTLHITLQVYQQGLPPRLTERAPFQVCSFLEHSQVLFTPS